MQGDPDFVDAILRLGRGRRCMYRYRDVCGVACVPPECTDRYLAHPQAAGCHTMLQASPGQGSTCDLGVCVLASSKLLSAFRQDCVCEE